MPDPRLAALLAQSGDAATVAWCHHGTGDAASLPDPELAIAAAAELGNVSALQGVQAPKALRKAAAAALHRLKSRGVKVADVVAPRSFSLSREQLDVPARAWLGAPNAMGNCIVVLTATDFDGSCIVEVVVGGDKVQDQHGHAPRNELRRFWKDMDADPTMAQVPFLAGLHLADLAVRGKSVHGWDHFLSKVSKPTLANARLSDPLVHALPASDAAPEGWLLPAWLIPGRSTEAALSAMPQDAGPSEEGWLSTSLDGVLDAATREKFAAAADFSATVFGVLGKGSSAASALSVAARLRAGDAGSTFPELRSALLVAVFQEIQRGQDEQRKDMEAMMHKFGAPGGA